MTAEIELANLNETLKKIADGGPYANRRAGNHGGVGNTLEDLLEVEENNLSLPDLGSWEIKSQRHSTTSLLTLFHREPEPRSSSIVARELLPRYGWKHQEAGIKYGPEERSFRQTIFGSRPTNRGFYIVINMELERVEVHFDAKLVDQDSHRDWLTSVAEIVGLGDLSPLPYWSFKQLENTLQQKLKNLLYFSATTTRIDGAEYYDYKTFLALADPTLNQFLDLLSSGKIAIDFDARTGHNHGTKFRIRRHFLTELYSRNVSVKE